MAASNSGSAPNWPIERRTPFYKGTLVIMRKPFKSFRIKPALLNLAVRKRWRPHRGFPGPFP